MPSNWEGQRFTGLIESCRANDVGVMNIRVFAAGVLATRLRTGREIPITSEKDLSHEDKRADAIFSELSEDNHTHAQTALRFSLANESISCVVIGVANLNELDEAITGALSGALPKSVISGLEKVYDLTFEKIVFHLESV